MRNHEGLRKILLEALGLGASMEEGINSEDASQGGQLSASIGTLAEL